MDPTTTLFTFMFKTHPSVQTVQLLGSWDNFTTPHPMQRDTRRDQGQWRGCHLFKNIVADGDNTEMSKRDGALKMGETYYYYYEVDGSTDSHDASLPSTNNCPFLPGQTVNTLDVPVEHGLRKRSASMNSLRRAEFKTMNPKDKFVSPRAPPSVPASHSMPRLGSSPAPAPLLRETSSARSLSPDPCFVMRRFLGLRPSSRGRKLSDGDMQRPSSRARSIQSQASERSRDISPESLRRFLVEDCPSTAQSQSSEQLAPKVIIPDDIAEEIEDDENFATSATVEGMPPTILSPPPFQRTSSSSSIMSTGLTAAKNESSVTIVPGVSKEVEAEPKLNSWPLPDIKLDLPQSRFSFSDDEVSAPSRLSPGTNSYTQSSFFDDSDGDDDFNTDDETASAIQDEEVAKKAGNTQFANYSLPRAFPDEQPSPKHRSSLGSPALITRDSTGAPMGNATLLTLPQLDVGVKDFVGDLGWMGDFIRPKEL